MKDRLKFRVWDTDEYVYSESQDENYVWSFENGILKCWALTETQATIDEPPYPGSEELDGDIEQCTGLKDKNGKLIYEGDVGKYPKWSWRGRDEDAIVICKIYWEDGCFNTEATDDADEYLALFEFAKTKNGWLDIEIIGNIHDNPELP